MTYLLDSHTLLWYTLDNPRLSETAKQLIRTSSNTILISPATYWEIAIKVSIGKLLLHCPYEEYIAACLNMYKFVILPIEPRHTVNVIELPFHHRDPFDRLLAAQALAEGIPLVSADSIFDRYHVRRIWN